MEKDSVCLSASTDDGGTLEALSRSETKRPLESVVESANEETLPHKKQVIELLESDLNPPVLDANASTVENASISQMFSCELTDCSSGPEVVSDGCSDVPSVRAGSSSVDSTSNVEKRDDSSISLSLPEKTTGIRRIKIIFGKSKGSGNSNSISTGGSVNAAKVNFPSYGNFFENSEIGITAAEISNGNVNKNTDLGTVSQMAILGTGNIRFCGPKEKMELKMSKKVSFNEFPATVRQLLSTGLLEGVHVKYISWVHKKDLRGIIKNCGYLCGCQSCKFSKVLNAFEFERHAGCSTKHPNNHIFLKNGKTVYGVVQEVKSTALDMLEEVIKSVTGGPINEKHYRVWKESFQASSFELEDIERIEESHQQSQSLLHDEIYSALSAQKLATGEHLASVSSSSIQTLHARLKNPMIQNKLVEEKRIARSASEVILSEPRAIPTISTVHHKNGTPGGGKRRDNDLHRLIFLPNGLPDGTPLAYYSKGQKLLEGYKQGNGIYCTCCNSEVSPSQFEAHAGWATRRQPYRHIYTSNGLSLHDLSISFSNGQSLDTGISDDMCTLCGDGGDLILCRCCPRAFHTGCLGIQCNPVGDWHCPYCRDNFGPGRKTSCDESLPCTTRPIVIRLRRVVKSPTTEIGGCIFCKSSDFSVSKFDERTVMLCDQCEKEFHVGCLKENGLCDLKELPRGEWFCGADCSRIHSSVRNLVRSGSEMVPSSLLSMIKRKLEDRGMTKEPANDLQWQLLSGKIGQSANKSLLSKAAAIFRECFDPIVAKSGRDLIPAMVYGRNIAGQEFGGMYCAVLTVNSVVVSAGILRIFGQEVAELPLVATSKESQGKGYFQVLFSCIERLLSLLHVENIVLPAAEEAESIWINKFGFSKMTDERLQNYRRHIQILAFQGTSMLEKAVSQFCD